VDEDGFAVTLRFAGRPQTLRVPWPAPRVFADPSVGVALKLPSGDGDAPPSARTPSAPATTGAGPHAVDGRPRERAGRAAAPAATDDHEEAGPEPRSAGEAPAAPDTPERSKRAPGDGKVVHIGAFRRRPGTDPER